MRALAATVLLAGCAPLPRADVHLESGPSQVLEILNRHQCSACHGVETVFRAPGSRSVRDGTPPSVVRPFPTLASMERLRADWLRRFLITPGRVRPNLPAVMPPQGLTPREIETLIAGWGAVEGRVDRRPAPSSVARGEALFGQKGCAACHALGERPALPRGDSVDPLRYLLAPDLSYVSARLDRATVEAWILDPGSVKPTTSMPRGELSAEEASELADYLISSARE